MAKRKVPTARFDLGDWVAKPVSGGNRVGQVIEYDTRMGVYSTLYGVFLYSDEMEPEFRMWDEPDLEPATPAEIAKYAALAAVQKPPEVFRDPQGPRR